MSYSYDKAALFPSVIEGIRLRAPIAPTHVQLIISDYCNEACHFCAYRDESYPSNALFGVEVDGERNNNPNRRIPTAKCAEIINDCAAMGVKAIQFTGGGEPTAHPDFGDILRHAQWLGLQTALVTNGLAIKDRDIEAIGKCDWVRVSIDAGCAETYAKIRGVPEAFFDRVIGNLTKIVEGATDNCVIGVGYVVTAENYDEVQDLAVRVEPIGIDNMRVSAVFQSEDSRYFDQFEEAARASIAEAKRSGVKVADFFTDRLSDLSQGHPDYERCGFQNFTTYIGGDQNIYRCCVTSYNLHGLLGSVKERRFSDVWFNEALPKIYDFDARSCVRCMFNAKNRTINYLVDGDKHAAFV